MSGPDRRNTSHPPRDQNQRRPNNRPNNRGPSRSSQRSRSRSNVFIKRGMEVYILDILQHGGVDKAGHSWHPICQVIEVPTFRLLEVNLNKKFIPDLKLQQKLIYEGSEESPLGRVNKELKYDDLTHASSTTILEILENYVDEHEQKYVEFINTAGPITLKRHSLEILPGVGKKLMWEIINYREKHPFTSFKEIHENVPGFRPREILARRIVEELSDPDQKRFLFVKKHHHSPDHHFHEEGGHDGGSRAPRGDSFHRR